MGSFGDADRTNKRRDSGDKEWKILETLLEVQKNKNDVLKITRVSFAGNELINFQVWRADPNTGKTYPLKEQKVSFNIDLKDKVAEALEQ